AFSERMEPVFGARITTACAVRFHKPQNILSTSCVGFADFIRISRRFETSEAIEYFPFLS
ncbi:MAG: hypothetical protein IKI52_06805, partial [Clostridia bacterium]|nr:hypothetical protein [Clostridia bacterium]